MLAVRWRGAVCGKGGWTWRGMMVRNVVNSNNRRGVHVHSETETETQTETETHTEPQTQTQTQTETETLSKTKPTGRDKKPSLKQWERWNTDQDALLRDLMTKNMSLQAMSDAVGRSYAATATRTHHIRRGNCPKPISGDWKPKSKVRESPAWKPKVRERSKDRYKLRASGIIEKTAPASRQVELPTYVHFRRWTAADQERILALKDMNMSHKAIAETMNRSASAISMRLHKMKHGNVPSTRSSSLSPADKMEIWALKDAGWSWQRVIIERFPERKPSFVRQVWRSPQHYVSSTRERWSKEETEKMMKLRNEGTPWTDVARIMGRTLGSVMYRFNWFTGARGNPQRPYRLWSHEEDEVLLKLIADGVKFKDVGATLPGRGPASAQARHSVLKVKRDAERQIRGGRKDDEGEKDDEGKKKDEARREE